MKKFLKTALIVAIFPFVLIPAIFIVARDLKWKDIKKMKVGAVAKMQTRDNVALQAFDKFGNEKKIFKYIEKTIADVDAVVIEDYGKGLITQGLVSFLVDKCGDYRKPLVVDPKKGHFLEDRKSVV